MQKRMEIFNTQIWLYTNVKNSNSLLLFQVCGQILSLAPVGTSYSSPDCLVLSSVAITEYHSLGNL